MNDSSENAWLKNIKFNKSRRKKSRRAREVQLKKRKNSLKFLVFVRKITGVFHECFFLKIFDIEHMHQQQKHENMRPFKIKEN